MSKEKIKEKLEIAMILLSLNGNRDEEIIDAIEYAIKAVEQDKED
jgi:hypothetical protein